MNHKYMIALFLFTTSFGCHAGIKRRLKNFFSCRFVSSSSESAYSSDVSQEYRVPPHDLNNSFTSSSRSHSREQMQKDFVERGILPEDIANNPTHPERAAMARLLREAME